MRHKTRASNSIFRPTKEQRSEWMSRVRGRGNKATELALIALLRRKGITGWRRNSTVFGRPDFIFPDVRLAVFVDGCFWHGCPLHGSKPSTNVEFWDRKLVRNRARDQQVNRELRARGWRIIRIWQHELSRTNEQKCVSRLRSALLRAERVRAAGCSRVGTEG